SAPGASVTDKRDTVTADDVSAPATRETSEADLKKWLIDAAVKQWQWAFGQPAYPWGFFYGIDGEVMVGKAGSAEPTPTPPSPTPTPTPTPVPAPTGPPIDNVGSGVPAPGGTDSNS